MLRKTFFLAVAVFLLALATPSKISAWGCYHASYHYGGYGGGYHAGYTHVGYGGVQHYGSTGYRGGYGGYGGAYHYGGYHYGGYGGGGAHYGYYRRY